MDIRSGHIEHDEAKRYNSGLSRVITAIGTPKFYHRVFEFIEDHVAVSHPQAWYYQSGIPPILLADQIAQEFRDSQIDQYLEGPYQDDPAYCRTVKAAEQASEPYGVSISREVKDNPFYSDYYALTDVRDEYCYVFPASRGGVNIALMRRHTEEDFTEDETILLDMMIPALAAAIKQHTDSEYSQSTAIGMVYFQNRIDAARESWDTPSGKPSLTPREREVLNLILQGYPNETIAERLEIALETVRRHRKAIYTQLGVSCQSKLFADFIEHIGRTH